METALLLNTSILLTLTIILAPILLPLTLNTPSNSPTSITHSIKTAFTTSLIPMTLFLHSGAESIVSKWEWKFIMNFKIPLSFKIDQCSTTFLPIALFMTWSVLQFASWYMASEPHITKFFTYLLIFLIAMLLLANANNMFLHRLSSHGDHILSFNQLMASSGSSQHSRPPSHPLQPNPSYWPNLKHSMTGLYHKLLSNPTDISPPPNSDIPPPSPHPSRYSKIRPIQPSPMTPCCHSSPNSSLCPPPL